MFAIAAQKSIDYGFGGAITGFAANKDLVQCYCRAFHAEHIGMLHEYQIFIDENPHRSQWKCMIMNGQMKKYKESLSRTSGPIMPSQIPKVKLDMRGLVKYAKDQGVAPIDLTQEEKERFMMPMV